MDNPELDITQKKNDAEEILQMIRDRQDSTQDVTLKEGLVTGGISLAITFGLMFGIYSWFTAPLSPEDQYAKNVSNIETQLAGECRWRIKNSAKYPSKVDFNGFTRNVNTFMNHNTSSLPHRFVYSIEADMMNGFGAMIPHTTSCYVNFSNDFKKYKVIEVNVF